MSEEKKDTKQTEEEEVFSIPFYTEDGEEVQMYVLEETMLQGVHYLMVSEDYGSEEEEATVMIIKEDPSADAKEEEAVYLPVEDETELNAVAKIFAELLDDADSLLL